ncbi:MAG: hypothetical protein WD603_03750 [Patescibacteria group bacterium]
MELELHVVVAVAHDIPRRVGQAALEIHLLVDRGGIGCGRGRREETDRHQYTKQEY